MTIVVDANIVAALVLPLPYSPQAIDQMDFWRRSQEYLIAPLLFEYELMTLLRRSVVYGQIERSNMAIAMDSLLSTGLVTIPPTNALHQSALKWADRIGQAKAYDAQYLALASRENAPLWTADRRLVNAARAAGLSWVHWVGDWDGRPDE